MYWFWRLRATAFFGLPGVILLIDPAPHSREFSLGLFFVLIAAVFLAANLAVYRQDRRRATAEKAPAATPSPPAHVELQAGMARLCEDEDRRQATEADPRQDITDDVHLRTLALAYRINAGLAAFASLFGLFYAVLGGGISAAIALSPLPAKASAAEAPPALIGWVFVGIGLGVFFVMVLLGWLSWRTAKCLDWRQEKAFCQVVAALNCLHVPVGTALGLCTFLVLARPSVAALFSASGLPGGAPAPAASLTGPL